MRKLSEYIRINEAIEDNLYWKLDQWFGDDMDGKQNFINVVSHCRKNKPNKETIGFMLDSIKFNVNKFVDFIMDNVDGQQEIFDYLYIMHKTIETIIANKTNKYKCMSQLSFRNAEESDVSLILEFIKKLADYEKMDGKAQPHVFSVLDPFSNPGKTANSAALDFYQQAIENKVTN